MGEHTNERTNERANDRTDREADKETDGQTNRRCRAAGDKREKEEATVHDLQSSTTGRLCGVAWHGVWLPLVARTKYPLTLRRGELS